MPSTARPDTLARLHPVLHRARGCLVAAVLSTAGGSTASEPPVTAPGFVELEKIDVHAHAFEARPELTAMMRRLNFRAITVCNSGTDGHLEAMHRAAIDMFRLHPDLYPFTATFDLTRRDEPAYVTEVIAWLDRMFEAGAVAVKIWKDIGLEIKRPDGTFILPDDPLFDPIYAFIARRGKPLQAHVAEAIDAWRPLDPASGNFRYLRNHLEWHLHGKPSVPTHAALMAARDNIVAKHPTLVVVAAHLASFEHDLDAIAERLDRYPNFHIECAARTRFLIRHPSERVRAFFIKYQDRILYGLDSGWRPYLRGGRTNEALAKAYVERREERYRSDYNYYAGRGVIRYDGRDVEALDLPRPVLEKFYHRNARRIFGLK